MSHKIIYVPLKSILLTTHIRIPVVTIKLYKTRVTPPKTPEGIDFTMALNFARKPKRIANTAANNITNGEKT